MISRIFERLAAWLCVIFFVGLLLPNHYSPWLSLHQELAAAIAFFPLVSFSASRRSYFPPLALGALALSLIPLAQLALGQLAFATDGWMGSLYLVAFALAVYAGSVWVQQSSGETPRGLAVLTPLWAAILAAAIISVGLAAHQWLMPDYDGIYLVDIPPGARPFANFAQPNHLATLLLLGLCGLMFVWEAGRVRTFLACSVACLLVFGLMMTGSRSVLLALIWFVPFYFVLRKRCRLRMTPLALLLLVAAYFIFLWVWPLVSHALLLPVADQTALDRIGTTAARIQIWTQLLTAAWQKPWMGWGWGQISMAQTATAMEYPAIHLNFESGHNLFLDLALWSGLPVAILCFGGLAWWGIRRIRGVNEPLGWICLVAIGFVFSHAMVEYPLYYAYFMLPVAILMGALTEVSPLSLKNSIFDRDWRALTLMAAALSGVLFVWVTYEYFPLEADWQLMRFQEARIGNIEPTEPPPSIILTSLHDFLYWSRVKPVAGMAAADIDRMREISERFAYAAPMYRLALAQALNGRTKAAQDTLARLCRMHTKKVCASARREWIENGDGNFPQLRAIEFPASQ